MDNLNIVLISAIVLFSVSYAVLYIKKIAIAKNIAASLVIPCEGILFFRLLTKYMPDSRQIIISEAISFALLAVALPLMLLFKSKEKSSGKIYTISKSAYTIFITLSVLEWIYFYYPAFYLFHIPYRITVISCIISMVILTAEFICMGRQKIMTYLISLIFMTAAFFLNYLAFINLVCMKQFIFVLLFAGSSLYTVLTFFHSVNSVRWFFKHSEPAYFILIILAQTFISLSTLLMIAD